MAPSTMNLKHKLLKRTRQTYPRRTLSTATLVEEETSSLHGLELAPAGASLLSNSRTRNKVTTASK